MNQPDDTTGTPPTLTLTQRFTLAEDVTYQAMGPEEDTVVLSLSQGQLFTCNGTATDFLAAVQEGLTLQEAAERLVEIYGIDQATAEMDLIELAATLIAEGLIVPAT